MRRLLASNSLSVLLHLLFNFPIHPDLSKILKILENVSRQLSKPMLVAAPFISFIHDPFLQKKLQKRVQSTKQANVFFCKLYFYSQERIYNC